MTEFRVEVVRLGALEKHPGADTLSIAMVHGGYPSIVRTADFKEGDLAVYVPIDALVPLDDPRFAFLAPKRRIRAARLRGIFSMGLLVKPDPDMVEGQDVRERMRIEKWEPPIETLSTGGDTERDPGVMPVYTDIEGLRRWRDVIREGEEVVLSEKIHGANARFVHDGERLWIGSRTQIRKVEGDSIWSIAAREYNLADVLARVPHIAIYGEVYGQVQDLRYGIERGVKIALFDAFDCKTHRYLDFDDFCALADSLGLPRVPVFYRGGWREELIHHCNGRTTMAGADHCREGFVVRPTRERFHLNLGRVVLKMVGEDYHLRKAAA